MALQQAARPAIVRANENVVWLVLATLVVGWLCLLFYQLGDPWDESEHAHAAWLISQGKRPLEDFFQHHQPLLWSVLAVYYRIGLTGAGVMIWGRVLVVLSGAATVLALVRLSNPSAPCRCNAGVCLSVALFIALTILLPALFVCRPETIATGAFALALMLWVEQSRAFDGSIVAIAGALAGAAIYASPRFVLLGGFFVLLGAQSPRRWLYLAGGGVVFVATYSVAAGFSLEKTLFNIEFSAYLQSIGERAYGPSAGAWTMLMVVVCAPLAALTAAVARGNRVRGVTIVAYTILIFALCNHLAGLFRYPQAYAPFVAAAAIAASWIGSRIQWRLEPNNLTACAFAAALLVSGIPKLTNGEWPSLTFDFLRSVEARDRLASAVPAGQTALLFTNNSPITIADASYYLSPMWDAQDRLCRAVEGFQPKLPRFRIKLPRCDFFDVLKRGRPFLTEKQIGRAVSAGEVREAKTIIDEQYRPLSMSADSPLFMRTDLVRLRVPGPHRAQ